ncbi:MAG: hypothetical protein OXG56_06490 [Gammaproteobacteria bacterium]|nr:hypothetical protein [Gammaproteobacteria bacterium]
MIAPLRSDQGIDILEMVFDTPVFYAPQLPKRSGIQRQRAALYIRILKAAGAVVELRPARDGKPALLYFEYLFKITDQP